MNDDQKQTDWKRMRFKRNKVWVALDGQGRPLVEKGKVLIKYQLDQDHQYWVHQKSVRHLDEQESSHQSMPDATASQPKANTPPIDPTYIPEPRNAIRIFTDGACSGNPGPAGIGVVMQYGQHRKEISRHIGRATNNIAELEAIRAGLQAVKNRKLPVLIYTDSSYALGVLVKGWKARQNQQVIDRIKDLMRRFDDLTFIKVKGHSGHPENERADRLAVQAIQSDQ